MIVSPIFVSATTLMLAMMNPTSPAEQLVEFLHLGRECADAVDFVDLIVGHQPDLHALGDFTVDHPNHHDHAAVTVEPGIENQRL